MRLSETKFYLATNLASVSILSINAPMLKKRFKIVCEFWQKVVNLLRLLKRALCPN